MNYSRKFTVIMWKSYSYLSGRLVEIFVGVQILSKAKFSGATSDVSEFYVKEQVD